MSRVDRSRIAGGILLILLGGLFLVERYVPGLQQLLPIQFTWPYYVIGTGLALLLFGLVFGLPGMAIPGCIVTGIGGILNYQFTTGDWQSWSFVWSLIPGFVGVGVIISDMLEGKFRQGLNSGLRLIFISAVLFVVFGSLLGNMAAIGTWWPVILIAGGLYMIARSFFRHDTSP